MKKTHIFALLIIAVAIILIVSNSNDYSTYADFKTAQTHPNKEYHVVGRLDKSQPQEYNPHEDANLFSFYMVDEMGAMMKVRYKGVKPDGFDQTEKIVVAGRYKDNEFLASQILMKCPSKYVDENKQV